MSSQNKSDFNRIYTKTYITTSHEDFRKAMNIADSLYSVSEEPHFKAKSLMLSAALLQEAGEVKKAVEYAVKAGEICKNSNDRVQSAEIYGFLATQFRRLKLYNQSTSYIQKASEKAGQIEDTKVRSRIFGLIVQENANYEIDQKHYKKAILLIEQSQGYFREKNTNQALFLASNERLLGDCFYYLAEYDKALSHYTLASRLLEKFQDNFLKGFIYSGMSAVYIKKKEIKKAKTYIDFAKKIADKTQYLDLKKQIYKTSQEYYALEKNFEKFSQLKIKEDALTEVIAEKKNSFINTEQTSLINENEKLQNSNIILILASAGILLIFSAMLFFYYKRDRSEKPRSLPREVILNNKMLANNKISENSKTLSPQVELKILKKLETFENSIMFTQKNISLSSLSIYCCTNVKYLSIVINSHKQKDFNNYINELRIKYLVNKIRKEPQYLKYKIVSLAEFVGFSTQSKFIEAFKKEMFVTPSAFIKSIKEQ